MNQVERRQFVRDHRVAIYGYTRKNDGPAMSVVLYAMEGENEILVSSMAERSKTKAAAKDPKVSLCVLDEKWPLGYLQVYCTVRIDPSLDAAVDIILRATTIMTGKPLTESSRAHAVEMAEREKRVLLRLTPYATFFTPSRHIDKTEDLNGLTHWTSNSMPW